MEKEREENKERIKIREGGEGIEAEQSNSEEERNGGGGERELGRA